MRPRVDASVTGRPFKPAKAAFLALMLAVALVSCGDPLVPPQDANVQQRLLATTGLAGVQVRVGYDPSDFEFKGIAGAEEGVLARAYDDGDGHLTVALIATGATVSGDLLRLNWRGPEAGPAPHITASAAYDASRADVGQVLSLSELAPTDSSEKQALLITLPQDEVAALHASATRLSPQALAATFADYSLGDIDKSGIVDVLDTLLTLDVVTGANASPNDYTVYHADVSGDDSHSFEDVEMLLAKSVDPTIPAHLVVKPQRLTYLELLADQPVLIGNGGSQPLTGLTFTGRNFSGSAFAGSAVQPRPGHSAVYTVTADPNDANGVLEVTVGGQVATVMVGNIVVLIAGQSNASGWGSPMPEDLQDGSDWPEVRALGNDYSWKPAVEALDNGLGQLDMISFDDVNLVSAGVQLGRLLNGGGGDAAIAATDRYVYLIPTARGASRLTPRTSGCGNGFTECGWYLGSSDLADTDRGTLFGSAAYRGLVSSGDRAMPVGAGPNEHDAEGGPVTAVYWYQGESDSSDTTYRADFAGYTAAVFSAFEDHFQTAAGKPVVIYAQLAPYGWDSTYPEGNPETQDFALGEDLRQMDIAERQRRMEEGAYQGTVSLQPATTVTPRANTHMVVTNDLPRSDRIHVSAAGQMILAERIALAYQEHYMGLEVDGTGPRVTGLTRSSNVVTVTFDRDVTQTSSPGANGYSGYFTAWSGTPNPPGLSASYGSDNEVGITDVRRDPTNPRAVQVTLATSPAAVYLRYMRPHENTLTSTYQQDVVRGADSGLPLPSFGPLRVN